MCTAGHVIKVKVNMYSRSCYKGQGQYEQVMLQRLRSIYIAGHVIKVKVNMYSRPFYKGQGQYV